MSRLYYTYDCITFFEIMLQTVWNNWTLSKTEEIFGNSYINNRGINTTIICKLKNILFICKKKSKENPYFLYHVLVYFFFNRIGGVMVTMLGSSAVDRGFESRSI